jgi:hypothetical protein
MILSCLLSFPRFFPSCYSHKADAGNSSPNVGDCPTVLRIKDFFLAFGTFPVHLLVFGRETFFGDILCHFGLLCGGTPRVQKISSCHRHRQLRCAQHLPLCCVLFIQIVVLLHAGGALHHLKRCTQAAKGVLAPASLRGVKNLKQESCKKQTGSCHRRAIFFQLQDFFFRPFSSKVIKALEW